MYCRGPWSAWTAPTLEGRIVRLEPLRAEHEEGLWLASRDPRTWRWLSVVQPQTRDEWSAFIEQALAAAAAGTELPLVTTQPDDEIVGLDAVPRAPARARLRRDRLDVAPPLCLGHGRQRRGQAAPAAARIRAWGCRRVELKTDALNERSCRALEALGATFEGIHRKHMLVRDGENRDSAWYSVTDDDWPAVRAHLEARLAEKVAARELHSRCPVSRDGNWS